jgi:hypothetical protein
LIDFFNQMQKASFCGTRVFEATEMAGVSMWQFVPTFVQAVVLRAMGIVDTLTDLLSHTRASRIEIWLPADCVAHMWRSVGECVASATGVSIEAVDDVGASMPMRFVDYPPATLRQGSPIPGKQTFLGSRRSLRSDGTSSRLVAASHLRHWQRVPGRPSHEYDEQIYPLLGELRRRNWDNMTIIDSASPRSFQGAQAEAARLRDRQEGVQWRMLCSYAPVTTVDISSVSERCNELWRTTSAQPTFRGMWFYRGVDLFPALSTFLAAAFREHLPEVIQALTLADSVIFEERPQCVLVTSEAVGVFERALVIKAGMADIPTIGLQHGMIFPNHYHYMHQGVSTDVRKQPFGFVRPTATCVWGERWKHNLTERGSYPSDAVVVTGNWRYDEVGSFLKRVDSDGIRARHGIGAGTRIAMVVSGNHNVGSFLNAVIPAIATISGLTPIVKMHPLDSPIPLREAIEARAIAERQVVTHLWEGLCVADIVITQISTVAAEALLFGRNVILTNFERVKGWDTYFESRAFLHVNDPDSLKEAIEKCLEHDSVDEGMMLARGEFLSQYFGKADGMSAARVADVIDGLVRPETPRGVPTDREEADARGSTPRPAQGD